MYIIFSVAYTYYVNVENDVAYIYYICMYIKYLPLPPPEQSGGFHVTFSNTLATC
jgi:hypothetical protein